MMDVDQPIEPPSTLHLVPLEDDTVDVTEPTSLTMPGMSVSNMSMDSPNPTRISDQKLSSETAPGAKDELNFGAVLMELSVPVPSDSSNHRGVESEQNAISDLKGAEYDYIKSEGMATKDENEIAQFEADLTRAQNSASGPADPNAPEVVRSFSAVGTADEGSRFYVKRRVLLGNVSKYLSVEKRDAGLEKYAYKWMIYLQGPPTSEDMTSFVRKVRFYLHPDYRPFDVVEVTEPPFRLTRYGWGEFPVRLQLYFVDERNKPVDIIHIVKLDKSKCGRQLPGSERFIDLELDRNTEFAEPRLFIKPPEPELDSHAERKSDMETDVARAAMAAAAAKRDALDRLLPKIVKQHPIIQASNAKPASVPYTVATSEASYRSWPMGKKKATELRRARLVLQCLRALPDMKHDVSLKDVVSWCVNNGYTPAGQAKSGNGEANAATTGEPTKRRDAYCRICGAFNAHDGDSEECDKRPPMWRGRVWSLSQANGILEKAGIGGIENLDDVSDADDINVDTMRDSTLVGQPGSAPSAYPWCAQEHSTVTDQQLEWVNRVVKQLRLPSSLEENAAGKQVTTGLIFETTKVFIRHLLRKTIDVYQQDQAADQPATPPTTDTEDTADPTAVAAEASQKVARPRLLVPYHLYRGIVESQDENSEFDFLTGAGLALGNLPEPSQEP
ncbi:yeats family-domain-containing protein [Powellomyces hirtus]|nr:yeats family-domain-containing protein [Powellomyces hirtus]